MRIFLQASFVSLIVLCFPALHLFSQEPKGILTRAIIYEGDTIPLFWLPTVKIYGTRIFKNKTEAIEYTRLVRNVKRVYPLAKLVGTKVNEINAYLNTIPNERQRKKELNRLEKELREQYQDQIMALTYSQGKILIKLIYRETTRTTYNLIEDYRGTIVAFFWQSFAKLFGYDLKITYDPNGRDREIENIVLLIEDGKL